MKDIATFCDKTIGKTNEHVKDTECTLKSATEKEEFEQIERGIETNEESTKRLLQQKKFEKFNTLKHKPQTSYKQTNLKENEKGGPIRTYANALVQSPRRRSPSQENKKKTGRDQSPNVTSRNTSTNDLSIEAPTPTEKKIKFLNPNKEKQTRAKSPSRIHSKTNYTQNEQAKEQAKETEELKK